MKKPDLTKFKIVSKKDWIIFWLFAVLAAYAVAGFFQRRIDNQLRKFGNPWLWEGNEPGSYGRLIAAVVLLALVAEAVCFLCRRKLWTKLAVLAAGILVPAVLVWMYWFNCRLIVSVLWDEEPEFMIVTWDNPADNKNTRYYLTPEEQAEVLELCRNLTVMSDEGMQKEFMDWWKESSIWRQDDIYIYFPEKYDHNYVLQLYVWGDYLYLFRGHGGAGVDLITLFEDNGLIGYMENLKPEQVGAAW